MKIGILTFQFGNNFGALLQCYALHKYLNSVGHTAQIIDYTPGNINKRSLWKQIISRKFSISHLKKIALKEKYAKQQNINFERFREKYFIRTKSLNYHQLSKLENFDAIIVGSDQVWNPSQHELGSYFLSHLDKYKGLRISYAPCCAINNVETKNKQKIIEALRNFSLISVRNEETRKFVEELTNINPPIVLDPTFLWSFNNEIPSLRLISENYILIYVLGKEIEGGHENILKYIDKKYQNHKKVAVVLTDNNPQLFPWADKVFYMADPIDWLNLFYYANIIYTDSFHGLVFAIKFEKPFIAYYAELNRASRFIDMSNRFIEISNHIISNSKDIVRNGVMDFDIDYKNLNQKLEHEITFSKNFLAKSLNE